MRKGWRFEFRGLVSRNKLAAALFRTRTLPASFSLEPTRAHDRGDYFSLQWTLRWTDSLAAHESELTEFGHQVEMRILSGGEEFEEDTWKREEQEEAAREANRRHNETYVPALGMTGADALRTLKPGLYVAGIALPLMPVPTFVWTDKPPDVSWMWNYVARAGVFVWVSAAGIQIRELGKPASESFWRDMIYFMQHGDDLHRAEEHYVQLMDDIIRQELMAMAMAYSAAPSIGPRSDLAGEAVELIGGQTAGKAGFLRNIDPAEAATLAVQTYGVVLNVVNTIEDAAARNEPDEPQTDNLFLLPVVVQPHDPGAGPAASSRGPVIQRLPAGGRGAAATGARLPPVGKRVQGFVDDLAAAYRDAISAARTGNPRATPSQIGRTGERVALGRVEALARRWSLDPSRVWVGDVPVGVTGPSGGVISAEIGSPYYKFLIELKKSPAAVRRYQAVAQMLSVDESINFPNGGRLYRVYGEVPRGRSRVVVHESER